MTPIQQIEASCLWGGRQIHSTHGVHPATPDNNRHIFRLSNDPQHGIVGVGPQVKSQSSALTSWLKCFALHLYVKKLSDWWYANVLKWLVFESMFEFWCSSQRVVDCTFSVTTTKWHNDGSFLTGTFSHVGYHIIRVPEQGGGTWFAHQGAAYDMLSPSQQERWSRLVSVNSNSGVLHPLVHKHNISKRTSIWLHLGMTGANYRTTSRWGRNECDTTRETPVSIMECQGNERFISYLQQVVKMMAFTMDIPSIINISRVIWSWLII